MFDFNSLELGQISLEYPAHAGFSGVYPISCGVDKLHRGADIIKDSEGCLLLYIVEGTGEAEFMDSKCLYTAGGLFSVCNAHGLVLRPELATAYLYILLRGAETFIADIGFYREFLRDSTVEQDILRICRHAQEGGLRDIYTASAAVYSLLMKILSCSDSGRTGYSILVQDAINRMYEDFAFLTGIDDLAEELGVTKSHLIRKFSTETGITPGKFLQSVRLEHAKLMLLGRDYSVEAIANMVGYSGANYFCKVFRRETGESPAQYRMEHTPQILNQEQLDQLEELEHYVHI